MKLPIRRDAKEATWYQELLKKEISELGNTENKYMLDNIVNWFMCCDNHANNWNRTSGDTQFMVIQARCLLNS